MHQRQITKIGNSLGITIPADYLHRLRWKHGHQLNITLNVRNQIVLWKPTKGPYKSASR
ncbi:hypothetical protein LCGC14_1246860 [marine sediment metagenome]|uniref:SpoVT-AbrB domain-containing protein n=1 Tax=marine sediment metagenome TaxID=412755 RepID=A0A0F9NLH1_9ZZZZ